MARGLFGGQGRRGAVVPSVTRSGNTRSSDGLLGGDAPLTNNVNPAEGRSGTQEVRGPLFNAGDQIDVNQISDRQRGIVTQYGTLFGTSSNTSAVLGVGGGGTGTVGPQGPRGGLAEAIITFATNGSNTVSFSGGTWTPATGVMTHTGITADAEVTLNGIQLQDTDYTVTVGQFLTVTERVRGLAALSTGWCFEVLVAGEAVDPPTATSNVINRETPTGSITFSQADIDGLDATINTLTSNVTVGNEVVASAIVTASLDVQAGIFNHTVTLDTLVAGWTFVDATLGPDEQLFTLVLGMDHEWTTSFAGPDVDGDLVINVANTAVETGIFYVDPTTNADFKLDNTLVTQGTIEDLGFQTEVDAAEVFQQQSPADPYVVTSTLSNYLTATDLPITVTKSATFPTHPLEGDLHYLTTNIYPPGTSFEPNPTPITVLDSGLGNQALEQLTATDPVTNETIVAGTIFVNQQNVVEITSGRRILPGGAGRTYSRGFVRDRSFNGIHVTRASTVGTTIITTTVSEVQYRDITTVPPGGGVTWTLVDATLHDFHYQQVTRNRAGSAIIHNLHYFVIRTPTGDINPYPSQSTAINVIEAAIQDNSSLWIDLVQGAGTPVTLTSTSALPTGSYDVMGDLGSRREETTYQFFPLNSFMLSNPVINNIAVVPDANGNVDVVQNDDVRAWSVGFTRSFSGVPTTPTTPTDTVGPYIYQASDWNRLEYDADAAGNVGATQFVQTQADWDQADSAAVSYIQNKPNLSDYVRVVDYAGDISGLQNVNTVQDLQIAGKKDIEYENTTLTIPSQTIHDAIGTTLNNPDWTTTLQVNGEDAVRVDVDAQFSPVNGNDFHFTYTALNDYEIVGTPPVDIHSGPGRYSGPDVTVVVRHEADYLRIELFKQIVASSSDFNDFKSKIANL